MWSTELWREHAGTIGGPSGNPLGDWAVAELRARGVAYRAMLAAFLPGGVEASVSGKLWEPRAGGQRMVTLPVVMGMDESDDGDRLPALADICAFDPAEPHRWYLRRGEYGMILGGDNLAVSIAGRTLGLDDEIVVYPDPLSWMLGGATGACFLSDRECRQSIMGAKLVCADKMLAFQIDSWLHSGDPAWPEIRVAAG